MTSSPSPITLENRHLSLTLSPATGSILQLTHKPANLSLINQPTPAPAWRIELDQDGHSTWTDAFTSFTSRLDSDADKGQSLHLRWETDLGLVVESTISLPANDNHAHFTIAVTGHGNHTIDKIEYPILTGLGALSDTADSYLAHPQGTGFLFRNPIDLFETEPLRRQGLRYSPYPEGFNGSTMQFMAYYAENLGGFYFVTPDPAGNMKWLNFYKSEAGFLESTFVHQNPDIQPGGSFTVPYPILAGTLDEGTWYEAAERYKAWAVTQPWTAQGTLAERQDLARWLLDEVGFATFGINAAHDRAAWLDRYHAITGKPVFHVLGVNWPKTPASYRNKIPGGRNDWFPANFAPANLEAIRRNRDYWAPFEFDILLTGHSSDAAEIAAVALLLPEEKYSTDRYAFPFSCPAAQSNYLPAFHRWRDEQLVGTYGADALYYDISVNNVLMACRAPKHGHPIGGGPWMVDAYRTMYANTKTGVESARGGIVPQGAEMISELFIPTFAYYQARAEASPLSTFEADRFRDWLRTGNAEKIPLFAFVYHEYGPVRLDGWAKLSREVGDLWYWVAARVALWGGLLELNYEFSALEALDGQTDNPDEHYFAFEPTAYEIDPAKTDFVAEIANARTGFARPYLVYGTMQRPLAFDAPLVDLDYFLYNSGTNQPHNERGTKTVPSVIHSAWRSPEGNVAFLFVNLQADTPRTISLTIDPTRYGHPADIPYHLIQTTHTSTEPITTTTGPTSFTLALEPRRVTMLEIRSDS